MSNPGRSLNALIPCDRLLDLLGCSIRSLGLPARTRCPICREGVLIIYDDPVCGGGWHWCRRCGTSGDLIELAAGAWKQEVPAVCARLTREGVGAAIDPRVIGRYQARHLQYRQRLNGFWNKARQWLAEGHPAWITLCRKLGVPLAPDWLTSSGRLMGAADRASVEQAFAPGAMQYVADRRKKSSPSASAVLRGPGWDHVLAIPFFDLPGRISSFLFVGRNGDDERDVVIKRANRGFQGNQAGGEPAEAGLLFEPQVLEAADQADNTVVALSDPFLALRLQARYSPLGLRPLPLVAWYDSDAHPQWQGGERRTRTEHAWAMVEGRRIIFWMPAFDIYTLRHAIRLGAQISTVGPRTATPETLKEYCWKHVPDDLLRHIREHARPWPEILNRELQSREPMALEALLIQLEEEDHQLDQLLERCSHAARQRVFELRAASEGPKTAILRGQTICEANNEWRLAARRSGAGELIVDAVLRIDAAVSHRRTGQVYYCGRVLYREKVVRFCEPIAQVEKGGLRWMQELLLKHAVGLLAVHPDWTKKAVALAQLFHSVRVEQGIDAVGWDRERAAFVFPRFMIRIGGDVECLRYGIFPDTPPGVCLNEPATLSGEELDRPVRTEGAAALFWATAGAIISNIVAPAVDRQPRGIALEGSYAVSVGQAVAEALGCIVSPVYDAITARKALTQERAHHWPSFMRLAPGVQRRHVRELLEADEDYGRNCLVKVDASTARVLALRGGWHVIRGGQVPALEAGVLDMARSLVPGYLRDLCQRRVELHDALVPGMPLIERVIRDLADYVDRHCADPGAVLSALDLLTPARDEPDATELADLLVQQLRERRLRIAAEASENGKPALIETADGAALYLSEPALIKMLKPLPVDPPPHDIVTGALADAGVLLECRDDGWVFDREWLETRRRRVEKLRAGLVRISA